MRPVAVTAGAQDIRKLSRCCRTLREIRQVAQLRQAARISAAGLPPFREAEAEAEALLLTLAGLSEMQVSQHLLQKTGIGREVNHRFLRMHPCAAVRDFSRGIVCAWKSDVAKERSISSPHSSGREDCDVTAAPKITFDREKHIFRGQATSEKRAKIARTCLSSERDEHIVIDADEDEQDAQRTYHESAQAATPEAKPENNSCIKGVADLSLWTVTQLKARIRELGLSSVGCTEKHDLVLLLSTAAKPKDCVQTSNSSPRHSKRRMTLGGNATSRLSLLRRRRSVGEASKTAKSSKISSQRHQLERVMRAKTPAALLGLREKEIRNSSLVKKQFWELSRLVHPDKCPPELCTVATQAFGKLKAAVEKLLC